MTHVYPLLHGLALSFAEQIKQLIRGAGAAKS